jgi:hypothetical protein
MNRPRRSVKKMPEWSVIADHPRKGIRRLRVRAATEAAALVVCQQRHPDWQVDRVERIR